MKIILNIKAVHFSFQYQLKTILMAGWFTANCSPTRLLLILLLAGGLPTASCAQPGSLDSTFGTDGKVITSLGSYGDRGNSVAIQSDEKIVLGGYSYYNVTNADFALVRYNSDGTLDNTFGIGGKVTTPVESHSEGNSMCIQSDGKIVLGGSSNWYLNLVRYNGDGTLDISFGTGGIVITDIEGYYSEQCKSLAIQSDGKILLGGHGQHNSNDHSYFVLVRYNIDGTLDGTFGTGGKVIGTAGEINSMGIQSNGKILLGGSSSSSFALVRYNANGTLDSTFDIGGKVITPVGSSAEGNSVCIQGDGKIVLGGYTYNNVTNADFALVRYNSDGTLDNTFGLGGKVITNVGSSSGRGNSVGIHSDGKILVGGYASNGANYSDFALVRYNSDGTLDNTFGIGGKVISPVGVSYSIGSSLDIQSDGKIVLAGYGYNGSNTDIALVRYNGDAGIGEVCCRQRDSRLYPNPFNSSATIQFNIPLHNAALNIYNVYGQEVKQITNISGQEIQLSRNNLPSGIYFLQMTEENKIITVHKLVIIDK